jgi:replicative superfamily II helicase
MIHNNYIIKASRTTLRTHAQTFIACFTTSSTKTKVAFMFTIKHLTSKEKGTHNKKEEKVISDF